MIHIYKHKNCHLPASAMRTDQLERQCYSDINCTKSAWPNPLGHTRQGARALQRPLPGISIGWEYLYLQTKVFVKGCPPLHPTKLKSKSFGNIWSETGTTTSLTTQPFSERRDTSTLKHLRWVSSQAHQPSQTWPSKHIAILVG